MSNVQLIEAVKLGDAATVEGLLGTDADVNQQDEQGWTPLNWAAGRGDSALVSLLVDKGADVFKVGRDLRTPYDIALSAGHVEVVKLLKDAEEKAGGGSAQRPGRKFCKAYSLSALRQFPGWTERETGGNGDSEKAGAGSENDGDESPQEDVVFLHEDLTVTKSMWHNEDVIFEDITPAWAEFCRDVLKFKVPDDLDYIAGAQGSQH